MSQRSSGVSAGSGVAARSGAADSLFARPVLEADRRGDGTWLLRSAVPLAEHDPCMLSSLRSWAAADPDYPLIAERDPQGGWRSRSYGEVAAAAESAGQALLDMGLGAGRPLMVLSGNSVDHLVISLAAMTAGVPVVPVSTAYSLLSADHGRIREITALVRPGAVFAKDTPQFSAALDAVGDVPVIASRGAENASVRLADLEAVRPGPQIAAAFAAIRPGSVAKILFTSGSTGTPKGVINTHGMLAANQQMIRQVWPFLAGQRPVVVDWLPWSHTFGGNHNVGLVLAAGGTLYVQRRAACARAVRRDPGEPGRHPPHDLLQRPRRVRPAGPGPGERPRLRAAVLLPAPAHLQRRRGAAAEPAPASGGRGGEDDQPHDPGDGLLGLDRNGARGDQRAFRLRRSGVHRRAAARRRGQAGPGRGCLRDPGTRPDGDPRLLRPARSDCGSFRRGRLLPDR